MNNKFNKDLLIVGDYSKIDLISHFFNKNGLSSLSLASSEYHEELGNIEFLDKFLNVKSLSIGKHKDDLDMTSINRLIHLERISFSKEFKYPPDLDLLPKLTSIYCTHLNKKWDILFSLKGLTDLTLFKYKTKDLARIGEFSLLNELRLISCNTSSFIGIEKLTNLKVLKCTYFRNVSQIESLPNSIEELEIANFPHLESIDFVKDLVQLKRLDIENCKIIESLKPVAELKDLKKLRLIGNTRVKDGDYSLERWIKV